MAGNIKGITIEIGGDTTGLSKALKGINSETRSVQNELKTIDKLLKLDPTNVNLLTQKQELLSKSVSKTRETLDGLKGAAEQLEKQYQDGTITQEQYRDGCNAIEREVIKQTAALDEQEKALKRCAPQWEALSAKVGKFGEKATAAGKALAPLSAVGGSIVGGMTALAVSAGKSADDLNTLAKQTGLTTEELQKFQYATDIIDVPLETLTGSMAKLTKNMATAQKGTGDAAEAFKSLGIEIENGSGQLRDRNDVFQETIKALGQMANETQRDAYAMQIFGRSAQDLNPLILGGADALKELGEQAEAAGLILSQDALDAANEFNDQFDILKATAKGTFAQLGTEIAKMLIPAMQKLSEVLGSVMEWLRGLDENTLKIIGTIALIVAGTAPLLMVIGQVAMGISAIITLCVQIGPAIASVGSALSALWAVIMSNPVVLVITAIIAVIGLLVAGIKHLWDTNEGFRNAVIGFWNDIKNAFASFDEWLTGVFATDWSEKFGAIGDVFNAFSTTISGVWDGLKTTFSGVIDFIAGTFTMDWRRAWEGIKNVFKGIMSTLDALMKAPMNAIISMINGMISAVNQAIQGLNRIQINMPNGYKFGVNIPQIPKIPYLEKGGILSSGSAIIAEAGPELLRIENGKAIVTPLTQSAKNSRIETAGVQIGNLTINPNAMQWNELMAMLGQWGNARIERRAR